MAMSSIVPVDVADLDDETRLKMQLTTLAESKRKQREFKLIFAVMSHPRTTSSISGGQTACVC